MGIYTNGIVYGIRIAKLIDDETEVNIIFERKDICDYHKNFEANN